MKLKVVPAPQYLNLKVGEGLGAQLAQSRAEAKKMALSLAQYATLEAEWMSERDIVRIGPDVVEAYQAWATPSRITTSITVPFTSFIMVLREPT